jgi:hypothetical protein
MSGSYSSPFDPSGADAQQSGLLGLSPDLWRTIAQFGGAMSQAANARTPSGHLANGTGFLGPLGAATGDAFQQAQRLAELRSKLAEQAATTGRTRAQIPLLNAQTQGALAQVPHTQAQTGLIGAQTGLTGAETAGKLIANTVAGAQAGPEVTRQDIIGGELEKERTRRGLGPRAEASGGYLGAINKAEGTGQNPRSSAVGFGQFIDSTWRDFARENPQYFQGMSPEQVLAAKTTPGLGERATEWLANKNAPVLARAGIVPNGAALSLAHLTGAGSAVALLKSHPNTPVPQVLSTVLQPDELTRQLTANPSWSGMTAGQLAATRAGAPDFVPSGPRAWAKPQQTQQVWDETPQPAGGQQQASTQPAPQVPQGVPQGETPSPFQVAQAGQGALPLPGPRAQPQPSQQTTVTRDLGRPGPDPEHLADVARREAALAELNRQDFLGLRKLSPDTAKVLEQGIQDARARAYEAQKAWDIANSQRSNRVFEGGAGAIIRDANQQVLAQNPISQKIIGPDGVSYDVRMNTVNVPGYKRPANLPEWAPEGALDVHRSERGPGETTAQTETARDAFGEKARSGFASALNSQRQLAEMESEFDALNAKPGWYSTGTGAEWKMRTGRTINTLVQSMGGKPIFNEEKLAAGEDIVKLSKLLGMQVLTSSFGGNREAASIVESTQKAVPGMENTPLGAKLLLSSMKEGAQFLVDQHTFMSDWYQTHKGDMVGADVAFAKAYSPNKYAFRAISQIKPYEVSDPKEYTRYLPGTRIIKKGGDPKDVRVIPDAQ